MERNSYLPLFKEIASSRVLVFLLEPDGRLMLLREGSRGFPLPAQFFTHYDPEAILLRSSPAPRAVRMYGK